MHVCDDNTFCPVHQRNDIRTYRRRRINLDISQNLRVYNYKLKDQGVNLIMTQKSGVFIIIIIIIIPVKMLLDIFDAFISLSQMY